MVNLLIWVIEHQQLSITILSVTVVFFAWKWFR